MNIRSIVVIIIPALLAAIETGAASRGSEADNALIALTLKDSTGHLQIFTIHSDGTHPKQLTFEGDNGRPVWSRDGKKIAYGSRKASHTFVAVMDADGSNQKMLCEGNAPDWSPDGRTIAFSRADLDSLNVQIWMMDANGMNERQITYRQTTKVGPSWSPDSKQIVFTLIRNPQSPNNPQPQIGIMNADGTNERVLTTEHRTNVRINPDGTTTILETAHDANAPAWSPVTNQIAFWSGIETRYGQIWVINSDSTGSRQLTDDPSHRNSDDPSWSSDGKKILFSTGRSGRNELWIMDADGKNQKRMHDIEVSPFPGRASWQPSIGNKSPAN